MKYLFIFLPFFAIAQGGDSTLYGVRNDTMFITGERFYLNGFEVKSSGFHVSDRKPKVVESFKWLGAYYELRENGWYKEILPDTISPPNNTLEYHDGTKWISCDQQFGNVDHPKRDKIEQSEVKILVWTGCALAEYRVTKFCGYNYCDDQLFMSGGTMKRVQKDFILWYLAGDKWIKNSHVIKEL